jgi:hypothetical protein
VQNKCGFRGREIDIIDNAGPEIAGRKPAGLVACLGRAVPPPLTTGAAHVGAALGFQGTGFMKEEALKAAVGQFLKNVNFTAQRELEKAVRNAFAAGKLQGRDVVTVGVTLASETVDLNLTIYNKIALD